MTWLALLPSAAIALAILTLPGLLVTLAAGLRGFFAVAFAPLISVSAVALAAVLGRGLGFAWWALAPVLIVVFAGCGWAVDRRAERRGVRLALPARGRHSAPWWIALAIALLLWARHLRNVWGRPDAFSQTFDNIWHLNAIRYIVDTGNASSLTLAQLNAGPGMSTFYPAAFHDLAALVMMANGGSLLYAVNGVLFAIVAWVWPLAVLAGVRSAWSPAAPTVVGIGVLAASFALFPLLLLDFGVLYPNLLGYALLPAFVGLGAQWLRLGRDVWLSTGRCLLLGLIGAPGLALAHPNAAMALYLIMAPLLLVYGLRALRAVRQGRIPKRTARLRLALLVAALAVMALAWRVVRPPVDVGDWPPPTSTPDALGRAMLNAPLGGLPAWAVSVLMILGIVVAVRRRLSWLIGAWLAVVAVWLIVASFTPGRFRLFVTGIWYQDSVRFSATLALVALPLSALGLDELVRRAALLRRRLSPASAVRTSRWGTAALSLVVVLGLVAATQRVPAMNQAIESAASEHAITPDSPLIDSDEYALLQRVPELVPKDAVIAIDPWNGSALVYALTGRRVVTPHVLYGDTTERETVRDKLDEAATDPQVCPVLRAGNVGYVLDFGTKEVHGGNHAYPGFDQLATASGFDLLAQQGSARLYRITACG